MICQKCRVAAPTGRMLAPYADAEAVAAWYHAECPGGNWCDCQHRTTPAVIRKPADISTVLIGAANE